MHPTAEGIIADIELSVYKSVARSVVGEGAKLPKKPRWTEIDGSVRTQGTS
jgi:hypothetical protein